MSELEYDFANDILQPLEDERIVEYLKVCKAQLPRSIIGHHFLLMQHRWKQFLKQPKNRQLNKTISPMCKYKIFVHRRGKQENCTFFAVNEDAFRNDPDENYSFVFTLQENCHELRECLWHTRRINWDCEAYVIVVNTSYTNKLSDFFRTIRYRMVPEISDICLLLSKERAKNFVYEIPSDVFCGRLSTSHADTINNVWPHRSTHSYDFIKSLIILNGGIGLFLKSTNELVAWVLTNDFLIPGCLQVMDTMKGRGLGKLIMKIYCKNYAETENMDLFVFVLRHNTVSLNLMKSIGFVPFAKNSNMRLVTDCLDNY